MKTAKQRETERRHKKVLTLWEELRNTPGSRGELWRLMEKKTGYTRENIQRVLRINNVDY